MSSKNSKETKRFPIIPIKDAPFTLKDIRDSVPKHCFERSTLYSLWFVLRDTIFATVLYFLAYQLIDRLTGDGLLLNITSWVMFAFVQGTVLTGLWVCAHECGHSAFSESEVVNGIVGTILHSLLLVPYYSWKFSHAAHHGATNHLTKDQTFVPPTKEETTKQEFEHYQYLEDAPLVNLFYLARQSLIGWQAYLILNIASQKHSTWQSHFLPSCALFTSKQRKFVSLSNWAILTVLTGYWFFVRTFGFTVFAKYFLGPYLVTNFWLIFYTYLHHTDRRIAHYTADQWNYVRGALATIDRPYDWGLDYLHHHIGSTHVLHHLFSRIPHYHAQEAAEAMKKVVGKYYCHSDQNIFASYWNEYVNCKYVDDEETKGVFYFQKK